MLSITVDCSNWILHVHIPAFFSACFSQLHWALYCLNAFMATMLAQFSTVLG